MKTLKTLIVLLLLSSFAYGQNRAVIRGKLLDSLDKTPLEFATVALTELRDSALIAYTLSTKDGSFTLRNLPADREVKLVISYVGYRVFRRSLALNKGETTEIGDIYLARRGALSEVVITAERQAVIVKPDTIEFAPEAFKTRPNAVLEDLLKKLPGLQVDLDGTISVNGKKVTKITVDGKDFFVSDITVASKNINVDLIDKIQVLTDREHDPDKLKDESELDKVINIKLKRAIKKSVFGKVYASGGTVDRFESGGLINMFRDTLQLSLIGFGNNLNKSAFSSTELNQMGGFNRSGTSTYSSGVDFGGRSYGLQKVASGGFNLNYDWKKKGRANLMYFYGGTTNDYENAGNSERTLADVVRFSNSSYLHQRSETKHNLSGLFEYKFNKNNTFRFEPKLSNQNSSSFNTQFSSTWKNLNELINESSGNSRYEALSMSYSHNMNYRRRLKKKDHSFTINQHIDIRPDRSERVSESVVTIYETSGNPGQGLNQFIKENEGSKSGNISSSYHLPLTKKFSSDLEAFLGYEQNDGDVETYRYNEQTNNYDVFIAANSNEQNREQFQYSFKPGLTYKFSKNHQIRANVEMQYQDVNNNFTSIGKSVNKEYFNLLPTVNFFGKGLSIGYNRRRRLPYIGQMQPVAAEYTTIDRREGNPDLKPSVSDNFNFSYYKSIPGPQIDLNVSYNFTHENNSINYAERVDTVTNGSFSKPVNVDGRLNSYIYFNFSKRFKKTKNFQFRFNTNLNGSFGRRPFYLSTDDNFYDDKDYQWNYNLRFRPGLSISYRELVDFEPSFSFNKDINEYEVNKKRNRNFYNTGFNNMMAIHFSKKLNLELEHNYTYNSQIGQGMPKSFNLLNASLSLRMFKKENGQLKLNAYDLLDQNNGVYTYGYAGENYYGSQQVLHRYFLLGYVYNFNKTVTK